MYYGMLTGIKTHNVNLKQIHMPHTEKRRNNSVRNNIQYKRKRKLAYTLSSLIVCFVHKCNVYVPSIQACFVHDYNVFVSSIYACFVQDCNVLVSSIYACFVHNCNVFVSSVPWLQHLCFFHIHLLWPWLQFFFTFFLEHRLFPELQRFF